MKKFIVTFYLVFIVFLTADSLKPFQWYEKQISDVTKMVFCNNDKYLACQLKWRKKIVIFDAVNLKVVTTIPTKNEDYFFSASEDELYIYYRATDELVTYSFASMKKSVTEFKNNITINSFITASEVKGKALISYLENNSHTVKVSILDLKTRKNQKLSFNFPLILGEKLQIDAGMEHIYTPRRKEYFKLIMSTGQLSRMPRPNKPADDPFRKTYLLTPKFVLLREKISDRIKTRIRVPKNTDKKFNDFLVSYKSNRVILLDSHTIYISMLKGVNSKYLTAKAGEQFTLDFKLPPMYQIKLHRGPDGITIKDGIMTWEVPGNSKKGPQKIYFNIKEPGKLKEVLEELEIEIL